ncbi:MAG TPA: hypothetical protein V6C72_02745, partial [Chroococcales cyanobacterium]
VVAELGTAKGVDIELARIESPVESVETGASLPIRDIDWATYTSDSSAPTFSIDGAAAMIRNTGQGAGISNSSYFPERLVLSFLQKAARFLSATSSQSPVPDKNQDWLQKFYPNHPNPIGGGRLTAVRLDPSRDDRSISADRASIIKAKAASRLVCFALSESFSQVDFFAASGGDTKFGFIDDSFLSLARKPGAIYPPDDSIFLSPELLTLSRIIWRFKDRSEPNFDFAPLRVVSVSDKHDHVQLAKSEERPPIYDRERFTFLPFQVNARRYVVPYYVMTRDIAEDLPPEEFTVEIKGLPHRHARVTVYDPIHDVPVSTRVEERYSGTLSLTLTATDYPYILTIDD